MESLESLIIESQASLVILDSIASIARLDFDSHTTIARQEVLVRLASSLKVTAERARVPVVVSNQVTSASRRPMVALSHTGAASEMSAGPVDGSGSVMTAALGVLWAHSVNTRLALDFPPNAMHEQRRLTLAKSSLAPVLSMVYTVEGTAIIPADPDGPQLVGYGYKGRLGRSKVTTGTNHLRGALRLHLACRGWDCNNNAL